MMKMARQIVALSVLPALAFGQGEEASWELFPTLKRFSDLAASNPDQAMAEIRASPLRAVAPVLEMPEPLDFSGEALPVVTAHGMGDACWEPGMHSITTGIGQHLRTYSRCIPTGNNIVTDTINGFLLNMDKSLKVFAEKIRADPKLKGGFNAIGFSQGNSLIRGYIEKYNDPPVHTFISVHGTVMGVAAFPSCFTQGKEMNFLCRAVDEVLGDVAYTSFAQSVLFQANYFRDPAKTAGKAYLTHSQIAAWNNENPATANSTLKANFAKTQRFVAVKAMMDSMVYPNEGEWWGSMPDGSFKEALPLNATKFYQQDLFGLRTASEAGKFAFESTPGDHLEFSKEQLYGWVDKYFVAREGSGVELLQV